MPIAITEVQRDLRDSIRSRAAEFDTAEIRAGTSGNRWWKGLAEQGVFAVALPEHYAKTLRTGPDPVLGRIERGECLLDLRALEPDEDEALHTAVLEAHRCG